MNPSIVSSQIRSALAMLRAAVVDCPDELWNRTHDHNRFWVLAYHTVFYAHLYLSPSLEAFESFDRDVEGRAGFGREDLGDWRQLTEEDTYKKEDVVSYIDAVDQKVAERVESTSFDAPSGFHWLPFRKGEAHLYNLRHIQHHAGQLAERLRQDSGSPTKWVFHRH